MISRGAVRKASWPRFADAIENASFTGYQGQTGTDNSFLGNHQLGDMFLRIPDTVYTPYIGHTEVKHITNFLMLKYLMFYTINEI
jgi:hypothetical protein